ncbi:MAG TPA: EAL domain-containing protein [Thermoanaerobaculia bacterium]|nr:EAL domain-containing protein [Thermoanaerobaculia bacterium]
MTSGFDFSSGLRPAEARRAFEQRLFSIVYQPIVHLETGRVLAHEALARSHSPAFPDILGLLRALEPCGLVGELGRDLRKLAVRGCSHAIALNVMPLEFAEGWLVRPDDSMFLHRAPVYLEITESAPLEYFEQCLDIVDEVRRRGLRIAIDDFGAGYSNLRYISDLRPDLVKLDRKVLAGVKAGNRVHLLLRSIVRLIHEMGSKVVAEGIETPEELYVVRKSGADYGQGYLLALPAPQPITSFDWPVSGDGSEHGPTARPGPGRNSRRSV